MTDPRYTANRALAVALGLCVGFWLLLAMGALSL